MGMLARAQQDVHARRSLKRAGGFNAACLRVVQVSFVSAPAEDRASVSVRRHHERTQLPTRHCDTVISRLTGPNTVLPAAAGRRLPTPTAGAGGSETLGH
jgi:hypothetical protein